MSKMLSLGVVFFLLTIVSVHAQDSTQAPKPPVYGPPVQMEAVVGNRGVMYQLLVNKKFQSIPQLGFFSITNTNAGWEKERTPDVMTQAHLTYRVFKGLDVSAGMQYSPVYAFRPVAGLIYSYASPSVVVIVNPKVDLVDDMAMEHMALVEYKPILKNDLRLYTRIQGLYGFVPESGDHNRSYLMFRLGVNYKEFTFGAATNFDWYGPMQHRENNIGGFVSVLLF